MRMFNGLRTMMATLVRFPAGTTLPPDLLQEIEAIVQLSLIHVVESGLGNVLPDQVRARVTQAYLDHGPVAARAIALCPLSKVEAELVARQVTQLCALIDQMTAEQPSGGPNRILH